MLKICKNNYNIKLVLKNFAKRGILAPEDVELMPACSQIAATQSNIIES